MIAPVSILGCIYLFFSLPAYTLMLFAIWAVIGLTVYFLYSRSRSHVGRGVVDVPELDPSAPPLPRRRASVARPPIALEPRSTALKEAARETDHQYRLHPG